MRTVTVPFGTSEQRVNSSTVSCLGESVTRTCRIEQSGNAVYRGLTENNGQENGGPNL